MKTEFGFLPAVQANTERLAFRGSLAPKEVLGTRGIRPNTDHICTDKKKRWIVLKDAKQVWSQKSGAGSKCKGFGDDSWCKAASERTHGVSTPVVQTQRSPGL